MNKSKILAGLLAVVMLMGTLSGALAANPDADASDAASLDAPATLERIADYLLLAADGYNAAIDRDDLMYGMEGGADASATRLQALVMVSRAFGPLPAPAGGNRMITTDEIDLSGVPEWARADLENLRAGGALAPADLGQAEASAGYMDGMLAEDDVMPLASQGESEAPGDLGEDSKGFGLAVPEGAEEQFPDVQAPAEDPLNAPASLRDVKTFCGRIYSLLGADLKDDFYAAVNKAALENTSIPSGEIAGGGSNAVAYETNEKVRALIREIVHSDDAYASGSDEQKIRDFYHSVLAARPDNVDVLEPWFQKIDAAQTLRELRETQTELISWMGLIGNGLLPFSLSNDLTDAEKKVLNLTSGFMVMTVEEYENPDSIAHQSYRAALMDQLIATGESAARAESLADALIALELEQQKNGMTAEEAADLKNYNNTFTLEELDGMMPALGMSEFVTDLGFDASILIQTYDVKALRITAEHMTESELPRLKAQVKLNLLNNSKPLLMGAATEDEALDEVSAYLSSEVGRLYVQRYFSPEAKADVEEMVDRLIAAFKTRISELGWMSEETRQEAIRKLDTLVVLIGYPDEWPENRVSIAAPEEGGSYFENMAAIGRERLRQDLENQKGGGDSFGLNAFMVNAAANRQSNTLVFPAGILQPPFYAPDASFEENLGGIGVIIAHEITHVFDDQGAQYDASGAVRNWWTDEDYAHFLSLCEKVKDFYDGAEWAPGISADGRYTLSENIADIGGMACALEVLSTLEEPDYDQFFRSYAAAWLQVIERGDAAMLAASDDHAPKKLRVNKVLQNFQEFFDTYGVVPGDGMYVAPEDRMKIW